MCSSCSGAGAAGRMSGRAPERDSRSVRSRGTVQAGGDRNARPRRRPPRRSAARGRRSRTVSGRPRTGRCHAAIPIRCGSSWGCRRSWTRPASGFRSRSQVLDAAVHYRCEILVGCARLRSAPPPLPQPARGNGMLDGLAARVAQRHRDAAGHRHHPCAGGPLGQALMRSASAADSGPGRPSLRRTCPAEPLVVACHQHDREPLLGGCAALAALNLGHAVKSGGHLLFVTAQKTCPGRIDDFGCRAVGEG